ncbi:MAG: hypothetical protein SGI89_11735 [bacterium]|nr:hypothetical protein [bacterium]
MNSHSAGLSIRSGYYILSALYLAYLFFALNIFDWVIDDLYIYFRYAENFAGGKGIVYNPNEFVEGFSSFSWFLIISLFQFFNLPPELSSKISGLILAFLITLIVYKICLRQNTVIFSLLAASLMLFNLPFMLWSVSGFETMFYVFLIVYCFYNILNLTADSRGYILPALLIFLISISRPEGICYSMAFIVIIYLNSKNKSFTIKTFSIFAILFSGFLIFRYIYFGDLLPNTYYAKIGHGIFGSYEFRTYKNGIFYILYFFKDNLQFLIFFLLLPFIFKKAGQDKFITGVLLLIAVQFFFVAFSGGDWMIHYRFVVPAIPFLSIAVATEMKETFTRFKLKEITCNAVMLFVLMIIALNLFLSDHNVINKETILWNNVKKIQDEIKSAIPPGSLAAIGPAGIIPYALNSVNFIDMVGLTNKYIARNGYRHGTWFEKSLPSYVYTQNPEWLIMWKRKNNSGEFTFESSNPGYQDMAADSSFQKFELYKSYQVYDDDKVELYKLKTPAKEK